MSPPSAPAASGASGDLPADLFRLLADLRPAADTRLIRKAYEVAGYWHQGQKRKSGDPYIAHPVAVATILAELGADDQSMCAALLHDVIAGTPCTLAALSSDFGAEIADLVTGTMALDAAAADQLPAAGVDGVIAAALAGDQRILLIKLADRLHNMRTLRPLPRARQLQKSRQTLKVQVPLARALGMDAIRSELENLASATLQLYGPPPQTAAGRMLAAAAGLLPASARARWREEWLGELHVLATRRERVTFAAQIVLGIGRLAVTLYRPAAVLRRACSAVLAAAVSAAGLIGRLICALRNTPPRAP